MQDNDHVDMEHNFSDMLTSHVDIILLHDDMNK